MPLDPRLNNAVARNRDERKQGGGEVKDFLTGMPSWIAVGALVAYRGYKAAKKARS